MSRPARLHEPKVNAGYRLPAALVKRVKRRAVADGVQPCYVVERLLKEGLARKSEPQTTEPQPA